MKIKQVLAASVSSLALVMGLGGGMVGATSGMNTTGPESHNEIETIMSEEIRIRNDNDIDVNNCNHQEARTGNSEVEDNTTGGDARTGSASNANELEANISVKNNGVGMTEMDTEGGGGSMDKTGPESHNEIETRVTREVEVNNDNDVRVNNVNNQTAISGNAEVENNTTGGSAITGNATNTNSTSLTVNVTN